MGGFFRESYCITQQERKEKVDFIEMLTIGLKCIQQSAKKLI